MSDELQRLYDRRKELLAAWRANGTPIDAQRRLEEEDWAVFQRIRALEIHPRAERLLSDAGLNPETMKRWGEK